MRSTALSLQREHATALLYRGVPSSLHVVTLAKQGSRAFAEELRNAHHYPALQHTQESEDSILALDSDLADSDDDSDDDDEGGAGAKGGKGDGKGARVV